MDKHLQLWSVSRWRRMHQRLQWWCLSMHIVGGQHGPMLKVRLHELIGEEQVFDLANMKRSDFIDYGLVCLEKLVDHDNYCARATRERIRIMVAGGDSKVGWVFHSLGELSAQNRETVPLISIIPLGTCNDLSMSFGWGGSFFFFAWKSTVKRCLNMAVNGHIYRLDSWRVVVSMPLWMSVAMFCDTVNLYVEDSELESGRLGPHWQTERASYRVSNKLVL